MNPTLVAVRAGLSRGWIELKQTLTTQSDLIGLAFRIGVVLAVVIWTRHTHLPGTDFSLGTATLVSVLGLNFVAYGVVTMGDLIVVEREDGTLLRAKATPNGMLGYLIGKVVSTSGAGAVLGSLFPSQRAAGPWWLLLLGGLTAISGIFYPITHLPVFLQWIGQAFPLYWLGLGMRSALLPNALAAVEIGHSWRHLATFGVLAAWSVAGLVLAPVVLRRMARRESGSTVAVRREKAMRAT
jgi:ABC-2 type transport system permease protein